jgi:metal-responsive CopG/Arc/MetJ family transcriptional regulator
MRKHRAIIEIPRDLADRLDAVAGTGNRSKFVVELLDHELRRRRQADVLRAPISVWKDEDHPDLAAIGEEEWVRQQRHEGESRLRD